MAKPKKITEEKAKKIDERIRSENDGQPPAIPLGELIRRITTPPLKKRGRKKKDET